MELNVNIVPQSYLPEIRVSKNDNTMRTIKVNLIDEKCDPWTPPAGASAVFTGTKPSGLGFTLPCTISGSAVTFVMLTTACNEVGRFPAEVRFTDGSGGRIGSCNVMMNVERDPHSDDTTDGDEEELINEITALLEEIREEHQQAIEDITDAKGGALDAITEEHQDAVQDINNAKDAALDAIQDDVQAAADSAAQAAESERIATEAMDAWTNMSAEAVTLPAGSDATASYSDGLLSIGVPKGDKGDQGPQGDPGATGATPDLQIGTVETLDPGEDATATITGTPEEPILSLGIPQGEKGDPGDNINIAPTFNSSLDYDAGRIVIYDGLLYMFVQDHSAGAWSGSDVKRITASSELSLTKEILENDFGVVESGLFFGYGENNTSNAFLGVSPFIIPAANVKNNIVNSIKLKVVSAGTLRVGYYNGTPVGGGSYDQTKVKITNVITITATGTQIIQMPNPFVVPDGCSIFIGLPGDTIIWKYGSYGTVGFYYQNSGRFVYGTTSIGVDFYGYALIDYASALEQLGTISDLTVKVDGLINVLEGEDATIYNGYSQSNTGAGYFATAPYVMLKNIGHVYVSKIKINVRHAGTITFGTVSKSDVASATPFDRQKLKVYQTFDVTEPGVQFLDFTFPMEVLPNEYAFYGVPEDTAGFYYGSSGADTGFFYVANGVYNGSSSSVNIDLIGFDRWGDDESTYSGKTLSILGDSISTFAGYIPDGNETYYPSGTVQAVTDTWWKKLADALNMTIDVNNSWSGSRVTTTGGDASAGCMTRCENLGTDPDVIIVWMGINDFNNEVGIGTYDGESTVPVVTTTFREAYAIMLNKILTKYQRSEVWVCTLPQCERNADTGFPEINGNGVALLAFNKAICELANAFGVKVLDHNKCGLTYQNMPTFNPDNLHPNKYGHSLIANNDIRQMDDLVRTRYATK